MWKKGCPMKQKKAKLCGKKGGPCNFRLGRRRKGGAMKQKNIAQLCAEKGGPMEQKKRPIYVQKKGGP